MTKDCNGCFGAAGDDCQRCQEAEESQKEETQEVQKIMRDMPTLQQARRLTEYGGRNTRNTWKNYMELNVGKLSRLSISQERIDNRRHYASTNTV